MREIPDRKAMPDEDVQEVEATSFADLCIMQKCSVALQNYRPPQP